MLHLKSGINGASLIGVKPELTIGLLVAVVNCLPYFNILKEIRISSITDSRHGKRSLHYKGYAFDISLRRVDEDMGRTLAEKLQKALGDEFQAIYEGPERQHIHIEWDPSMSYVKKEE